MTLLQEAQMIAKRRSASTGGAVYLYRYTDRKGYAIRDCSRGPLENEPVELIEIVGGACS